MSSRNNRVVVAEDVSVAVRLGVLCFSGLNVRSTVDDSILKTEQYQGLSEVELAAEVRIPLVRTMYRQLGMDPTRTRPSSEALLRRVRRGLRWPCINTLVDLGNRCSLETLLPYGLYDLRHIVGAVQFRRGGPQDEYVGIRKSVVHLEGRPALCDDHGPFGNPTSDSVRTMITTDTTSTLIVVYCPRALARKDLDAALDLTVRRLTEHGAYEKGRWIEPCE